jgi:hypothetical protein
MVPGTEHTGRLPDIREDGSAGGARLPTMNPAGGPRLPTTNPAGAAPRGGPGRGLDWRPMPTPDRSRVKELKDREDARFHAERPRAAALLERGRASMPNGVPMAWLAGSYHHVPPWVAEGHGARFTDARR